MNFYFNRFIKFAPIILFLTGCKAEWSQHEKDKIIADCKMAAERYGFTDPDSHCDCVLRKIINRYPNPNQFENMEMGEFGQIVNECQGQDMSTRVIWPEKTQKAFVDSCTTMAINMKMKEPKKYCTCVLDEMIRRYPTNDSIGKITPLEMKEIGTSCQQ